MLKELDTRDYGLHAEPAERLRALNAAAEAFSLSLPGNQAVTISRLNALTGTPQLIEAVNAVPLPGSLIDQALALVQRTGPVLGFAGDVGINRAEFVPDPRVQTTSSGASVVHLQQYFRGIPVFVMARAVAFSRDQTPQTIVGDNVDFAEEPEVTPAIDVKQAMRYANEYISANQVTKITGGWGGTRVLRRINTSKYTPKVLVMFAQPSQPTVLDKGVFEDYIPAHLVLFHQGPTTRLGWHFIVRLPRGRGQYRIIVAADQEQPGEILYVSRLTLDLKGAGQVHPNNGDDSRQSIPFPRPLADYPVPAPGGLPAGFPPDWVGNQVVTSGADTFARTLGNNVIAAQAVINSAGKIVPTDPALGKIVNNSVDFEPATDQDQRVLNMFYFVNFLHDFFYLLGFDETSGNFQEVNPPGRGGHENDGVLALAVDVEVPGVASMGTPVDSLRPLMVMGLIQSTGRHTALDADVVFHEFTHGVTNRLVGGPFNVWALNAPQSMSMGEGWSDYFALTIQNAMRNQDKHVVGDWVTNDPVGIRKHPYDESYPGNFGHLGKTLGSTAYNGSDVHTTGEIWCATLMAMTRRVIAALGQQPGYNLCWRIVIDGLKLTPVTPSFLDARDAILRALDDIHTSGALSDVHHKQVRRAAWEAFAKFGMGPSAISFGPGIVLPGMGIVADFNLPPGV